MKIVISIGGSVLVPDEIDKEFIENFAKLIREIHRRHELVIVTGGGKTGLKALNFGKIVVMGGTHPGHSTDAVAALFAEYIHADLFINATDVDGIYDRDPQKYKDAKRYEKLSVEQLVDMVKSQSLGAGKYELIDILAAKVIQRSKLKTIFLNGRNIENMKNAIEGKKFIGTVIENG